MPEKVFFWDGYLHCARVLEKAHARQQGDDDPLMLEPVFGRVKKPLSPEAAQEFLQQAGASSGAPCMSERLTQLKGLGFLAQDGIRFDPEEVLIALSQYASAGGPGDPALELFFYRKLAETVAENRKTERYVDIIDVGIPAIVERVDDPAPGGCIAGQQDIPAIGALIDNDIGFLNGRFRYSDGVSTRFHAIWLQSRERLHRGPSALPGVHVHIGRVLTNRDIDALISDRSISERSAYAEINRDLYSSDEFRVAPPLASHGTAVADLAFGADPGSAMADIPLLAVQLPPEAAIDTTGTTSESYIVQGFRWLCHRARQIAADKPLIVNISYGAMAGQKDGGKFIENQIAREVAMAEADGQTVHVVYAFGNSRNSSQVARLTLPPRSWTRAPAWMVPPESGFPSFMEIRAIGTDSCGQERLVAPPTRTRIRLTEPAERNSTTLQARPGKADPPLEIGSGIATCRLYNQPERALPDRPDQIGCLLLAIAPTRPPVQGIAAAPVGDWALELRNPTSEPLEVVLQIQRGDRAPGFDRGGRQSFFAGHFVNVMENGFLTVDVVAPLHNAGTNSSYSTARFDGPDGEPRIHTAGARRVVLGSSVLAAYSGEAAPWTSIDGPTAEMPVDGLVTYGRTASGTYTGTLTRLSGTSAAAAIRSRELLMAAIAP